MTWTLRHPHVSMNGIITACFVLVFGGGLWMALQWDFCARLVPEIITIWGIFFGLMLLATEWFRSEAPKEQAAAGNGGQVEDIATSGQMAMDLHMGYGTLTDRQVFGRALIYFMWVWGVLLVSWLIGFLPTLGLFLIVFMRFHGKESWLTTLLVGGCVFAAVWGIFDYLVNEPWPQTVIGDTFPVLRTILPWF